MPFGEELLAGPPLNLRPTGLNYPAQAQADGQRIQFTQKERDGETNLDYFGARHYANTLGRFMSADPKQDFEKNSKDPQRWNLYSYALNNPLANIDSDGRESRAAQMLDQDIRALARGEITPQQYNRRNAARAAGAFIGVTGVGAGLLAYQGLLALGSFAASNPRAVNAASAAVEGFLNPNLSNEILAGKTVTSVLRAGEASFIRADIRAVEKTRQVTQAALFKPEGKDFFAATRLVMNFINSLEKFAVEKKLTQITISPFGKVDPRIIKTLEKVGFEFNKKDNTLTKKLI